MDLFIEDLIDQHIVFKVNNGKKHGFPDDVKIEVDFLELDQKNPIKELIRAAAKEFGMHKEWYK